MTLKTYRARTMAEALAEVKRDLGRDAMILHTRTYRIGSVLGMGGRSRVEVTASSALDTPQRPAPRSSAPAPEPGAPRRASPAPFVIPSEPRAPSATVAVAAPPSPILGAPSVSALETQVDAIRRMLGQVLTCSRTTMASLRAADRLRPAPGSMPEPLLDCYLRLLDHDLAPDIADQVIAAARDELSAPEMTDPDIVRQTVLRRLALLLPAPPPSAPRAGPPPRTIALVGPTGVGKTTTIAKLAAAEKLRLGRRVGMITCDTYRIAAVDQLRTYAQIIGVPLHVAMTPADVPAACAAVSACDVVLIDTAGRSPRDAARVDELRRFLDLAAPDEVHLVLSGASAEPALLDAADRFAPAHPSRVAFTKLDEAVSFGPILSAASRIGLSLSFLTTGQEVPDHIEPADPQRLASLALDGVGAW